jgi:hypothetical protein
MDFISANMTNNVTSFQPSTDDTVLASLQILPGQSNYSMLLDSTIYDSPNYDVVNQNVAVNTKSCNKKQRFDPVTQFYLGALTVVGLLIVFRMTYKNVL